MTIDREPTNRPDRDIPTRDEWLDYEVFKRLAAVKQDPGTEEYDRAIREYLREHNL